MKKLKVWLVMSGEPLEMFDSRPHRIGVLSDYLQNQYNVDVSWWTTTFDHQEKKYLYNENTEVKFNNVEMIFLHSSTSYQRNISISRLKNHKEVAKQFKDIIEAKDRPDLILCCYPTIDLAYEAVKYGKKYGVKVIVDVRDLWPDIFVDVLPYPLKIFGKAALFFMFKKSKYVFQNCDSIIAVSQGYLNWAESYGNKKYYHNKVFPLGYKSQSFEHVGSTPDILDKYKIDKNKLIVWFVGTFGKTYDLEPVIEAAKLVDKKYNIQFVFSGDGENSAIWKNQSEGLSNIVFTGWIDKYELNIISKSANIGLMAYRKGAPQGLPNKIFEYMSLGIPIISSLESETKNILSEREIGLSYLATSSQELLDSILFYYDNPNKRSEHGNNANKLFIRKYSSEIVYKNMSSYICNLISKEKNEIC